MSFRCYLIQWTTLSLFVLPGVFLQELTPTTVDVIENSSVALTCSLTGDQSAWNINDNAVKWGLIYISTDGTCQASGFVNNSLLYSWNCYRNGSFTLTLIKVDRSQHGKIWTCKQGFSLSNRVVINVKGVNTQKVTLSPIGVDVLQNSSVVLTCSTTGSVSSWGRSGIWSLLRVLSDGTCQPNGFINNSSLYSWTCHNNGSFSLTLLKVNRSQHREEWLCKQGYSEISNTVIINVKVPVENADITTPSGSIGTLVENYYKVFICVTSYSRPTPSVKWFMRLEGNNIEINQTSSIVITSDEKGFQSAKSKLNISVNREKLGTEIYCNGSNGLGTEVMSRTVTLNVLYSPDIGNIDNISSEEGNSVDLTCPVINGNPHKTSVLWTRKKDERLWFGAMFTLTNISRTDSTTYTCRVNNTMIMTGGFIKEGITSKHIELDVLYKARVRKYFVLNNEASTSVTVSENETVDLHCEIEGNPTPTCGIYNDNNPDMEQYANHSQKIAVCYITFKASCLRDSVYTCKGSNVINKAESTEKNINVFVQCSPRPNPSVSTMDHIIAEVNTRISLHFTALAYPKPISASWSKFVGQSLIAVNESNNIRIYQSDLDFGMTIIRATNADIGEYKLLISNAIGSYIHIFYIEQKAASTQSGEPAKTGLIIGLTLALIFIVTLVTSVSVVFCRRIKQKRSKTDVNHSYQNVLGEINQHIGTGKKHEQIGLNVKTVKSTVKEVNNFDKEMENDSDITGTYEKLAENRKDVSQYSQIHSMKETQAGTKVGTKISLSGGEEERNIVQSNIYINLNI